MPWSGGLAMGSLHINPLCPITSSLSTPFHEREFNESDAITCMPKKKKKGI